MLPREGGFILIYAVCCLGKGVSSLYMQYAAKGRGFHPYICSMSAREVGFTLIYAVCCLGKGVSPIYMQYTDKRRGLNHYIYAVCRLEGGGLTLIYAVRGQGKGA